MDTHTVVQNQFTFVSDHLRDWRTIETQPGISLSPSFAGKRKISPKKEKRREIFSAISRLKRKIANRKQATVFTNDSKSFVFSSLSGRDRRCYALGNSLEYLTSTVGGRSGVSSLRGEGGRTISNVKPVTPRWPFRNCPRIAPSTREAAHEKRHEKRHEKTNAREAEGDEARWRVAERL